MELKLVQGYRKTGVGWFKLLYTLFFKRAKFLNVLSIPNISYSWVTLYQSIGIKMICAWFLKLHQLNVS